MKRLVLIIDLLALVLTVACAGELSQIQSVATDTKGKIVKDSAGNPVVLTHKISDEGQYYRARSQMAEARKPILEMRAKPGEDMVFKGVSYMRVWGYPGEYARLPMYQGQWVRAAREWGGIAGNILLSAVNAWGYTELARVLVDKVGGGTTVYGDYNYGDYAGSSRDNPSIVDSYKTIDSYKTWNTTTTGAE